jgi:hypothetical protein
VVPWGEVSVVRWTFHHLRNYLPSHFESAQNYFGCAAMTLRQIGGGEMEPRRLGYFLAVGEALNFTRAAVQLRAAKPALSRQVPVLEDDIGEDLLRRRLGGVTLTETLFLAEARATKGDVMPESWCEILRKTSFRTTEAKPKPARLF